VGGLVMRGGFVGKEGVKEGAGEGGRTLVDGEEALVGFREGDQLVGFVRGGREGLLHHDFDLPVLVCGP